MKFFIFRVTILMSSLFMFNVSSADISDKVFIDTVDISHKFQNYRLFKTGQVVRTKYSFKVYALAHYLDINSIKKINTPKDILSSGATKQVKIVFLRNLRAKQIKNSFLKAIKVNLTKSEFLVIEKQVEYVLQFISQDVKKRNNLIINWFSDDTVEVHFKDLVIMVNDNQMFAKALWSIWFGEKSVINKLDLVNYNK